MDLRTHLSPASRTSTRSVSRPHPLQAFPASSSDSSPPLSFLAAAFITSCPSTNPALPVKAFPAASVTGSYKAGDKVTLSYTSGGSTEYLVIYSGLTSTANAITDMSVTLPSDLASKGRAYAVVTTSSDPTKVTDDNTVAGPIRSSSSSSFDLSLSTLG